MRYFLVAKIPRPTAPKMPNPPQFRGIGELL
jgi:hypothetical protein